MIDNSLAAALRTAAGAPRLLVASDYDGTLAPIVDDPDAALPYVPALDNLAGLARCDGVHAAIVSGRSVAALRRLTSSPDAVTLVGSHGREGLPGTAVTSTRDASDLIAALESVADRFPGAAVEVKPTGAALHYRNAKQPEEAAQAGRRVAGDYGVRALEGKMVVEVLLGEGDKGTALAALRASAGADCVVFLGDDTTDEAAFSALDEHDVGVKVGPGRTAARYRVAGPEHVAAALGLLLAARSVS